MKMKKLLTIICLFSFVTLHAKQLTSEDTVVVKNNDYAAVYMNQQEFRPYHIRYENPHDALVALSNGEIKYFLWGGMPLRKEIQEMALDNVNTCDVDIPTGELHFTGTDQELINAIDEEFARMMQDGELELISDKWFHPERIHDNTPRYVFFIIGLVVMLIFAFLILSHLLRRRIKKTVEKTPDTSANTQTQQAPTEQTDKKNSSIGIYVVIGAVIIAGGFAIYWFKFRNKKQDVKGIPDPDDYDGEDEDDEKETEGDD